MTASTATYGGACAGAVPCRPYWGRCTCKLWTSGWPGLFYTRFMDDWVVLAPTRHKLRKAIKVVNQTLAELKLKKYPDKTFIARIEAGFDFLGYHFSPGGLTLAPQTIDRLRSVLPACSRSVEDSLRHLK